MITIGIMGGGIAQLIRTALPLSLCPHLNQTSIEKWVYLQDAKATLLESMIFSSFLKYPNLASSRGFVNISAS
jgi:hypothetical protein